MTVAVAGLTVWQVSRARACDGNWQLRWRALEPDDRARLAVAGLSGTTTAALVDPEERELAEGFGRQERRRRTYLDLALLITLAFVTALMLAGITHPSAFGLILATYGLLRWPFESFRDHRFKSRVRTETEPDAAPVP